MKSDIINKVMKSKGLKPKPWGTPRWIVRTKHFQLLYVTNLVSICKVIPEPLQRIPTDTIMVLFGNENIMIDRSNSLERSRNISAVCSPLKEKRFYYRPLTLPYVTKTYFWNQID